MNTDANYCTNIVYIYIHTPVYRSYPLRSQGNQPCTGVSCVRLRPEPALQRRPVAQAPQVLSGGEATESPAYMGVAHFTARFLWLSQESSCSYGIAMGYGED